MRELERRRPLGREQRRDAGDEVVDVRDLREDVVAEHEVGRAALLGERAVRSSAPKNSVTVSTPARDRGLRDVQRRLDAEHRDAVREEVLEEVAVVRRDLDDEAVGPEPEALDHRLGVAPRVLDPRVGVGGEVRVLGEDVLGRHELRDLDEPAPLARADVERVEGLGLLELLGREHGLAERRLAEVDDGQLERRPAVTACRRPGHGRRRARGMPSAVPLATSCIVSAIAPVEGLVRSPEHSVEGRTLSRRGRAGRRRCGRRGPSRSRARRRPRPGAPRSGRSRGRTPGPGSGS